MTTKQLPANNATVGDTATASGGRWLARLGLYHRKRALKFQNDQELRKAIDTLWDPADELYRMPRAPAGTLTMIVPEEAVAIFHDRGFKFDEYVVMPASRGAHQPGDPKVA